MTDFHAELVADLNAIGVEVEKAKMSRSEAGRVAANARWGNKGGAPKMVDWRSAAGISAAEQKSNARSKSAMQGARTRAQNKEANTRTPGSIQAEMERAGVPKKTIDAITKNPLGSASAKATAAHIKRVKDVNGLSSKQKAKYNEKMDMATPGMSPDMKHQDAITYALDAKAARPRATAARAAASARFKTVASQTSGKKVFTSSTVPNPGMRAPVSAHKEAIAAAEYHLENSKLTGAQTKKLNNTVRRSKDAIDRLERPEYNALKDRALRDMPSRNNGGSRGTGYLVGR
jgi:hypothetical protein